MWQAEWRARHEAEGGPLALWEGVWLTAPALGNPAASQSEDPLGLRRLSRDARDDVLGSMVTFYRSIHIHAWLANYNSTVSILVNIRIRDGWECFLPGSFPSRLPFINVTM